MSEEKSQTVSVEGDVAVEEPVKQDTPAASEEQKAEESKPVEQPAAEAAPEQPAAKEPVAEEAGQSALAQQVAPKTNENPDDGLDEILEHLREDRRTNIEDATEDDESDLDTNQILLGSRKDIVDDLVKHYPTRESFKQATNDEKSLFSLCRAAADHGWGSTSGPDVARVLKQKEAFKKLHVQGDGDVFPGIADGRPNKITHKNVEVAGREAILALKARLGGLVRVNLLSSGFWVALRAPEVGELQEVFATIDFENKEIGRMIGGHFALIPDMYLKKKFAELLVSKRIIVESNFSEIFKPGAFIRNLAFNDYETLLHGIVMLMSRGGLRYRMVCPKCGKVSTEILDVGACKFVNRDLWNDKVSEWWNNTITTDKEGRRKLLTHSEKDLIRYREEILGDHKETLTQLVDNGIDAKKVKVEVTLTEPTFARYFDVGERLIKQLKETINNVANGNEDKADVVRASLVLHGYQLAAPFVHDIKVYNAKEEVDMTSSDPELILSYLDQTVQNDTSLFIALNSFLAKSRFNYIGTHSIQCPECGAKPESDLDGFFPLETQTIFFALLSRLWLAGR